MCFFLYLESGYGSGGETSGSLSPQGIPYLRFSSSNVSATQEAGMMVHLFRHVTLIAFKYWHGIVCNT